MNRALILTLIPLALVPLIVLGRERKPLPGQAGNDNVELVGNLIIDRDDIKQAVGADLGPGYVVVKMQVTPKTKDPLVLSVSDFTIVSHKDGQRSQALEPGEIAGSGVLVVKEAPEKSWSPGTTLNGPMWSGATPRSSAPNSGTEVRPGTDGKDHNPLLATLKTKVLPDKTTKDPVEGLLYFPIGGKIRPRDLTIIYKGPGGRLMMEFAEAK